MRDDARVIVRRRREADLDRCAQLVEEVQSVDGYPPYLQKGDLRLFIESSNAMAIWVAETDGDLVGHVALNARSSDAVMDLASAVGDVPPPVRGRRPPVRISESPRKGSRAHTVAHRRSSRRRAGPPPDTRRGHPLSAGDHPLRAVRLDSCRHRHADPSRRLSNRRVRLLRSPAPVMTREDACSPTRRR